mgnify:FL=1
MWNGLTVLFDLRTDGAYLVTDDADRNIRIRYKPDDISKEEIDSILDGEVGQEVSN